MRLENEAKHNFDFINERPLENADAETDYEVVSANEVSFLYGFLFVNDFGLSFTITSIVIVYRRNCFDFDRSAGETEVLIHEYG